jgi:hypothetical protein
VKFSSIKESILAQFARKDGNRVVFYIVGCPGGGKSACAREIARELQKLHGIPDERIVEFNPSLRDPVDILGLPSKSADGTHSEWLPPEEFWRIRRSVGPSVLILEELSDAAMEMQNPMCRVILDRCAGQMPLSDDLYIIATGNRVEDRSGASRLSTKLANRMRTLEFGTDAADWIEWAGEHGISPLLRGFIYFRPNLLSDFDPKRTVNPTPRSWEDVSRVPPPEEIGYEVFFEHIKGAVGEGAASEYTAFLRLAKDLPDWDEVEGDPEDVPIPQNLSVLYALSYGIASRLSRRNIKKLWKFVERLSPEFQTIIANEAVRLKGREITAAAEYRAWVLKDAARHSEK